MQDLTHTFTLPSGVECEVTEMDGRHQRMITEQSKLTHTEKLHAVLADTIIRVGSNHNINVAFIAQMIACDAKAAMVEVRQFSVGEDVVKFTWEYVDSEGVSRHHKEEVKIPEGKFPTKTLKVKNAEGELVDASYAEYPDIVRKINIVLPRSGKKVTFSLLDGRGEKIGIATKKSERSSHTLLKMRTPTYKEDGGTTDILLDFDRMSLMDIEYLRGQIKEHEGDVDTTVIFEHPESELMGRSEKYVTEDLLGMVAFFFPSEAI